jgi:hypothetical protein
VRALAGRDVSETAGRRCAASRDVGQCLVYLSRAARSTRLHPELTRGRDACKRLAREITDFSLAGIERMRASKGESE